MRILAIRNDKLGDFMLAFPSFIQLKKTFPEAHVIALVPAYTAPIASLCPGIDEVIIDPGPEAAIRTLVAQFKETRADALIALFSTGRVAVAGWLAGIRFRLAPATKLAQLFYNHRLPQRRSQSRKPEWAYNLDLVAEFCAAHGRQAADVSAPFLTFPADETSEFKKSFCHKYGIELESRLVFIHPGSGGSASNLSISQYAALAASIDSRFPLTFILSAGPGEQDKAEALRAKLSQRRTVVYLSDEGLASFARHIAFADFFISGSTGPLHIAGALDVPTAAFYPRRRSATSLRWQTLNSPERRLAFSPPEGVDDMARVDIAAAARAIRTQFL